MSERRRRSRDFEDGDNNSKGVKVYEYYESKRTKSKKPNHRDRTTTVYTTKTITGKGKEPKHRQRLRVHIKPKPHEFEASEIDDLSNDQYFYEQLEKNQPTTESSANVEHVHEGQPNSNHDVVFYHTPNGEKREKHRQKLANNHHDYTASKDDDVYSDYGEMVMPDKDVEMHDTFEKNTKESYVHGPAHHHSHDGRIQPKKRRKQICSNFKNNNPITEKPNLLHSTNLHSLPYNHKADSVKQPARKRKFERIMVTKKLNSPDELHAEINKIFEMKNKHYDKRGHDKSHWELRIVPRQYDEPHIF